MPLHGKIVVVKRSGGDGTEFPITAACLFGRKPDCDIRIQLPQVSKEHCRIDLNENKEVILTNLSSVNPTRVNGEVLQQSERLKHGDVITIIDRSFRFEYPPAPTPKKRSSIGGKSETFKVLQDQQVVDAASTESGDKRISEVSTDPHLKDGTNHDNIQRSLEKPVELENKEDGGVQQNQTISPFSDLYQMIKKSLDVKTPRKSSASVFQTPTSRFCTPKPGTVEKNGRKSVMSTEGKSTPKKDGAAEDTSSGTPKSVKKQRKSLEVPSAEAAKPEAENAAKSETTSPQRRNRTTPQRFTVSEVVELDSAQTPKSPKGRRSKEATPVKPAVTKEQEKQSETTPKALRRSSPRNSGKVDTVTSKKRKSGELADDLPTSQMKKKRVSFGGLLNPELFDKRLPPDSPLRKGDAPRRSLCVQKPKQSLLRRASAIGLIQEFEQNQPGSPKVKSPARAKTPSPKKSPNAKKASPKTPSPGKKSPKSKSPSPKAATPAKKSPKSTTATPKAATPAKTPKSRSPSPKAKAPGTDSSKSTRRSPSSNKAETPLLQTPTVQGRFSVSRISTPSPVAEDAVTDQVSLNTATPKIPLRRKSMKSSARKTPSAVKSAVKAMHRRSGISRASMKAFVSYADMVKFGQMKTQVAAAVAAKKPATKKTVKKVVSKPQTPARKVKGHVSTGHANSPATIVLGRAQERTVVPPTGAAPKLVANIALLKKNMKMDEDLTGISEMYKTPVNQKKRRSVVDSAMNTPVGSTSTVEPSVLNTPEEPGEMMVSPLSVSAVKDRRYNSEAVSRLLHGHQECVHDSDVPAVETEADDSSEQQGSDLQTSSVTTPKQKPELAECLTGVKRMMRTPRQRSEPVEDLRGRLLKTPKQKPEQQECLTGVKRLMKTPRETAEPVEDLRGKILKTPKQKREEQECLTGVKSIFQTPQQEAEPLEDLQGTLLETPKAPEFDDDGSDGVEETAETAAQMTNATTPDAKSSPPECLTAVKRLMKTPREKSAPVEDMVGMKRLMKTPRDKAEPVEENFGIKRLMRSPRLRGIAPVDDFEGLQELMEEPVSESTGPQETEEVEDQTAPVCGADVAKELDFVHEEPQDSEPSDVMVADMEKGADEVVVIDHSEAAVDENLPVEEPKETEVSETATAPDHGMAMETVPQAPATESSPEVETAVCQVADVDEPVVQKKPVRGRRAKTAETKSAEEEQEATEPSEEPAVPAPVRGRRGKKTEAAAPPAVRQTKGSRNAKSTESEDAEVTEEKVAPKPKRGRNAKKVSDDQAETVQEVVDETELAPEPEKEQVPPVEADQTAAVEKAVLKPKRGRKPKLPEPSVPEQQDVSDDVPQSEESDAKEVCSDQLDVVPTGSGDNKSSDVMETVPQAPVTESSPEVETAMCEVAEMDEPVVQKKPVRGRRAKVVEAKSAEDQQEVTEPSEEPAVPAPVRGRRGKKTEAAAPPAVRQTKRGRNAKSQENTSDGQPEAEKVVEPTSVTEISTEAEVSDPTSSVNTHQEEKDSAAPAEEAVVKPVRGRKPKQTRAEPPKPEPEDEEVVIAEAQPQKAVPAVEKPRRGRRAKPETVEQNEVAEDAVVAVETKQQSRLPARAKRGRNAKQEEEKLEKDAETTESQEPVSKSKRTRNAEQDREETTEVVQTVDEVVPEEAEAPLVAEPVKINEPAAKPRRGRKAKQDTESETAVESAKVQEVLAAPATDKPKRGRRGKQVTEEAEVAAPEEKPEVEEEKNDEPDSPVVKSGRAKRGKNEDSQDVATKRTRRGAAPPLKTESTVLVSESAATSAEPVRRGRRAAAKPAADDAMVTSEPANPAEDDVAVTNTSARSVKWKEAVEVIDITPARPVRGKRANVGNAKSKNVSKDADKTEEKDLSEAVAEAQPVKRARRGAKVAEVTAEEAESASMVEKVEAEPQPKTRRGRPAKK